MKFAVWKAHVESEFKNHIRILNRTLIYGSTFEHVIVYIFRDILN